jgi:uncharacterized protein
MKIFIKDLSEGVHEFTQEVSPVDLGIPEPEFYPNVLTLKLYVDRLDNMFRVKLNVKTTARYICDRCLDEYDSLFEEDGEQIYQVGSGKLDDDDEVVILPIDTKEIDITKAVQDIFVMSRPIKLVCKDSCKGLCTRCGTNLNHKQCDCDSEEIDPRLEKLKSLLN